MDDGPCLQSKIQNPKSKIGGTRRPGRERAHMNPGWGWETGFPGEPPEEEEVRPPVEHEVVYRDKRVMITGGIGFIGSNLARRLVDLGANVLLVDSLIPQYGGNP